MEMDEVREENQAYKQQILRLESKLKTTSSIAGESALREQGMNQKFNELKEQLIRSSIQTTDLTSLLSQEAKFIVSAEQMVQELTASENSLVAAATDLCSKHTALLKANKNLKAEFELERKTAANKLKMAETQMKELREEMENQSEKREEELKNMRQRLQEMVRNNSRLQTCMEEEEAKCAKLVSDLKYRTEEAAALKREKEDVTATLKSLDEKLIATELQRDAVKQELEQIKVINGRF
ncbi:hypothetical protein GUITHDRAFT_152889, partial [Guillardia theta CCMP2712]